MHHTALAERLTNKNSSTHITNKLRIVNVKIISLLPLHKSSLNGVVDAVAQLVEQMKNSLLNFATSSRTDKQASLAAAFGRYISYHKKVLPYNLLRLQEESRQSAVEDLPRMNQLMAKTYRRHLAALDRR